MPETSMVFAILKLSYNRPGDSLLSGGICGTGFFVDFRTAVTAHHALNDETFNPNPGFQHALVWLVSRSGSTRRIERQETSPHPEIDTTIIAFRSPLSDSQLYEPSPINIDGLRVSALGHIGNSMPSVDAECRASELVIRSANLLGVTKDISGFIKRSVMLEVNSNDIKMNGVRGFELSFGSQVGMSGGPVVDSDTGKVVAMLSLGLPSDSIVKTQTFAVSIDEILRRC
jgi:hypothetical protein